MLFERSSPRPRMHECTQQQGVGTIPCPEGQPVGTTVDVFVSASCQASFISPGDPQLDAVASNFVDQPRFLFAVAQTGGEPVGSQYAVYFGSASDPGTTDVEVIGDAAGRTAFIGDAGIVKVDFGCGDGVGKEAASHPKTGYIVAPRTAPGPPETGSGTAAQSTQSRLWIFDFRVALGVTLASILVLVVLTRRFRPGIGQE